MPDDGLTPGGRAWLWLGLAVAAVAPVFAHPFRFPGSYDWRYFVASLEAARHSWIWFRQVPLWNPYACGGEVGLANPQSLAVSPLALASSVFGTALGLKLALVAYVACAFDGAYRLARSYGASTAASMLAAVLYGTNGWLALHVSAGHANFASAALFPYLALCYRRATADSVAWIIPLGGIAAWIVCDGGTSTPAIAVVLLLTLAATDVVQRRSARPVAVLVLGGVCAVALSAFRLLPVLEFALDHPRRQLESDAATVWSVLRDGYWWQGAVPVAGRPYAFHEYGWRLATVSLPLALWAAGIRQARAMWVLTLAGASIALGDAWSYGPWWLLKHAPFFRDLRVPSRYTVLIALALPVLCASAFDDLRRRIASPRVARLVTVTVLLAAAVDGVAFDWYCFRGMFDMPLQLARAGTPFHQEQADWRTMVAFVAQGQGVIGCDEEAPLQRAAALVVGPGPQLRLDDDSAGRIREARWTPNRVDVDVDLARPATLVLNQNWNEHWYADRGAVVKWGAKWPADADGGRLAVAAPEGRYRLSVSYRPRSFVVGAAVSVVAWPLLLALFAASRTRVRRPAADNV